MYLRMFSILINIDDLTKLMQLLWRFTKRKDFFFVRSSVKIEWSYKESDTAK